MLAGGLAHRDASHILTATRAVVVKRETGALIDAELPSDGDGAAARNVRRPGETPGTETGTRKKCKRLKLSSSHSGWKRGERARV